MALQVPPGRAEDAGRHPTTPPDVLEDIVSTKIITVSNGKTHLRIGTANPVAPAGRSYASTECGREVLGYAGTHESGDLTASITCGLCRKTVAFEVAIGQAWTIENHARIMEARAYVTSKFFPPLPAEYGDLAVQAVDACNADEWDRMITIPASLQPQPRHTVDGKVEAWHLVDALRLQHMVADPELDDDTVEGECESHGVYGTCPEDGVTYVEAL